MSNLNEIALKTIDYLNNAYFKIVKDDDFWKIEQYSGLVKHPGTMMREGWNTHKYLSAYITNEYPIFRLSDFISKDGILIERKTDEDLLKEELYEYIELFNMNRSLATAVRQFKSFAIKIYPDFLKCDNFTEAMSKMTSVINTVSASQLDKANMLMNLVQLENEIFKELDKMHFEDGRNIFDMKFKYFFMLIRADNE